MSASTLITPLLNKIKISPPSLHCSVHNKPELYQLHKSAPHKTALVQRKLERKIIRSNFFSTPQQCKKTSLLEILAVHWGNIGQGSCSATTADYTQQWHRIIPGWVPRSRCAGLFASTEIRNMGRRRWNPDREKCRSNCFPLFFQDKRQSTNLIQFAQIFCSSAVVGRDAQCKSKSTLKKGKRQCRPRYPKLKWKLLSFLDSSCIILASWS